MRKPIALSAALLVATFSAAGRAQTAPERGTPQPSLKSRFGVEGLRRPLRAESSVVRQRAFERLGNTGTNAALELLSAALAPGGDARDARERLVAVRALSAHVDREIAVDALVRALAGTQTRADAREALVEETAALALSRSNRPRAQKALAQALRQPGRVSETARLGLLAHRPSSITLLLDAPGTPTLALVELLGELGDARAAGLLAGLAESAPDELRAAALDSLAAVDRPRALAVARAALKNAQAGSTRARAVRVLVELEDAGAPAAFAALLGDPAQRAGAFELALQAKSAELGGMLARLTPDPSEHELWLGALGRAGGSAALARLERVLSEPEHAWAAAYALARSGDRSADEVLERALERPGSRRDAARAAALRKLAEGRSVSGLEAALAVLERSKLPAERASAAFARAALDPERGSRLLSSQDPVVVHAAARAASQGSLALAAAARLAREPDPLLRASLAIALADRRAADRVPDRVLVELVEARGAAAPLAAYALAARDGEALRPRLRELLASSDALLRAHVALGLATSRDASVVGMLAEAYRFETEPRVRRALVTALAARRERGRRVTLRLAADLDPDAGTRERARKALGAAGTPEPAPRTETAWLRLDPRAPGEPVLFALLETAGGLALPVAADPDGAVTCGPLPPGKLDVTLVPAAPQ